MIPHKNRTAIVILILLLLLLTGAATPTSSTTLISPATLQQTHLLKILSIFTYFNTTEAHAENTSLNITINHANNTEPTNKSSEKATLNNINLPDITNTQNTHRPSTPLSINTSNIHTTFYIKSASNATIQVATLNSRAPEMPAPPFHALKYFEIHADNLSYTNVTIRIHNQWGRDDLVIYHYTDHWEALPTSTSGDYLEAVTESLSIFAVGAPGGINLYLTADTTALTEDTLTVVGAAYYNNSTAAANINIEVHPEWTGFANTTTDESGNFLQILDTPSTPGDYTLWVNATDGSLSGGNVTVITATNTSLYKTRAGFSITDTSTTPCNLSFNLPQGAVVESSNISITLDANTSLEVRANNITIYSATTDSANLNLTGYLTDQNDLNITTDTPVNLTYNLTTTFHTTQTATITKHPTYYSASLPVINDMSYDWNNTNITHHLPEGAYCQRAPIT